MKNFPLKSFLLLEAVYIIYLLIEIFINSNLDAKGWWAPAIVLITIVNLIYIVVSTWLIHSSRSKKYLIVDWLLALSIFTEPLWEHSHIWFWFYAYALIAITVIKVISIVWKRP